MSQHHSHDVCKMSVLSVSVDSVDEEEVLEVLNVNGVDLCNGRARRWQIEAACSVNSAMRSILTSCLNLTSRNIQPP